MTKTELTKIAHDNCILDCEIENAIQIVQDLLEFQVKELERDEPYAVNTIARLKSAAHEVSDLQSYVENALQEEEE